MDIGIGLAALGGGVTAIGGVLAYTAAKCGRLVEQARAAARSRRRVDDRPPPTSGVIDC